MKKLLLVVVALSLLTGAAAFAQDQSPGTNFLRDLLRELDDRPTDLQQPGQPQRQAPIPGQDQPGGKRIPFGRQDMQLSFAPLVKETAPAVVNVYASAQVAQQSPFAGDPFFERFFGGGAMPPRQQSSLGSGVIVDKSGIVVTNFHVIRGADEVKVALPDGREYECKVLLKDERLDLAVLKLDSKEKFPTISIGNSDALEVGDLVLAMGNPFGVGQTTTSGIVSALARSKIGISDFGFFIQTDAAINPGNSGGALINMSGQLIGINTAIYSRDGGSNGIGFAIPSNMVQAVVASALQGSDVFERPYIGAGFDVVTAQMAEALGLARPSGAIVSSVDDNSPASRAGLRAGDVVLRMNGALIEHVDALGYRLATQKIGSTVDLLILRQGKERNFSVTLIRAPAGQSGPEVVIDGRSPFAGAKVAGLSPRNADRFGLPTNLKGVVTVDIAPGSMAGQVGLQPGDIVRVVNGKTIETTAALKQAASERTRRWSFSIERNGRILNQTLFY